MTDFFEKLKKGMDTKSVPEIPETPVEPDKPEELDQPEEPEESEVKPDLAVSSIEDEAVEESENKPKKKSKKKTKPVKKKKIEIKESVPDKTKKEASLEQEEDWLDQEFGQLTIDPEDLDISIEDDLLIIKGKREKKFAQEKKNYFYQECFWGEFSREVILPVEVDNSRVEASMDQGVLTIRIPKIGTETKKKITVK
jgi:hypothetical protein